MRLAERCSQVALIALGVVVAGCGEEEEPSRPAAQETELTVTVRPQEPGGERRIRTISCPPHARRMPCPPGGGRRDPRRRAPAP